MSDIQYLVEGLASSNDGQAFQFLKLLEEKSSSSSQVYPFFDNLAEMLDSDNSYIRARGILLIAANAKWDTENKIDGIIGKYLNHITDEKPITARQCIKSLPAIAKNKPNLRNVIKEALSCADLSKYKENMQSLILKDIQKTLDDISEIKQKS
ncbi:MAG: hypothetical protein PHW65_03880 [Dehalococcoidales bacterium]|nr:hypothetical protein [Dehalococcoidales bacterium]